MGSTEIGEARVPLAQSIEPEVYDAAQRAVEAVAQGVPSWLITLAVNAALDAFLSAPASRGRIEAGMPAPVKASVAPGAAGADYDHA